MQRSFLIASTVIAAAAAMTSSASAQCVNGVGNGGGFPVTGSGDGTFDTVLPSAPLVVTLSVPTITAGNVLKEVHINGVTHTWSGDTQWTLESPANPGVSYNLLCGMPSDWSADFGGSYVLIDPIQASSCAGATAFPWNVASPIASGTYMQDFGGFTNGSNGIFNTGVESIPVGTGTWTLRIYDWVGGDIGALTSWDLCFGPATTPPPPLPYACVTGGAGFSFPPANTVTGVWDTSLPTNPVSSPLSVVVPAGSTKIQAVKLNGLTHTWAGDAHFVLQDPAGTQYNLLVMSDATSPGGGGCGTDFAGDYVIVDANVGQAPCGPAQPFTCGPSAFGSGTYLQSFSTWTSGNASLLNVPLESIPISSGTWTLTAYDWYPQSDNGVLTSWDLCFDAASGPTAFCTAGTSTNGCVPAISASAQPSATLASACNISIANVEGQKFGIIFYGINNTGFTPAPWAPGSTSFLCVKGPTQRTGSVGSGGNINQCDGVLALDWNAYQTANPGSVGNPFSAGNHVYVQGWYRDPPAPKTTNLSNALDMTMTP
jgi:subtilisin-like proprotein convertase family protein